jgi:hypothetical protein
VVVSALRLVFGFLAGPIVWALQQQILYISTPYLCGAGGGTGLMYVVSLVALLAVAFALFVSWRSWRTVRANDHGDASTTSRAMLFAFGGVLTNAFFLVVIIAQVVPAFFLNPCQR